jgi:hypothetical protein
MIPIPSINYIPKIMRDNIDQSGTALCNKLDTHLEALLVDIINLGYLLAPDRCPDAALDEFGYFLNAGILGTDTAQQKRQKIYGAIAGHKKRSLFAADIKPKIDIVAGGDSVLVINRFGDDFILMGSPDTDPVSTYWASMGCDGLDSALGIGLIGTGYEIEVAGNVYIDVDNPGLSAAQITQIQNNVADSKPCYFRIHLGYIAAGVFVEYTVW